MTRENFYESIMESVTDKLAGCIDKSQFVMEKQETYDGEEAMTLMFATNFGGVSPFFNLDDYYESYLTGTDIKYFVDYIVLFGKEHASFMEETNHLCMDQFEDVGDKVDLVPISKENALNDESGILMQHFDYFSERFFVTFTSKNHYSFQIPIYEEHLEKWGKTKADLLEAAFERQIKHGPVLCLLEEAAKDETFSLAKNFFEIAPETNEIGKKGFLLLTNKSRTGGASLLLNPKILEKINEVVKADCYVFPLSIHEVLLLVDNGLYNHEKLSGLLETVNKEEVNPMNVLGDEILYFDSSSDRVLSVTEHMDQIIRKIMAGKNYGPETG